MEKSSNENKREEVNGIRIYTYLFKLLDIYVTIHVSIICILFQDHRMNKF